MPLLFRNVRGANRKAAIQELNTIARKEINKVIDDKVKPTLIKSHEIVVKSWNHKPKFKAKKSISKDVIAVTVFATGTNKDIWKFVDKGTRPHPISAKNAPTLAFKWGGPGSYKSKTLASPARTVSGGGITSGPVIFPKKIKHPGTKARNFTKTIAEDIKPEFKREIENAFKRTSNKIKE